MTQARKTAVVIGSGCGGLAVAIHTLAGRRLEDYVELLPVTPFYRLCWEDGVRFDYSNDAAMMCEHIRRLCPRDVQEYDAFLRYSAQVFHQGYTRLAHVPFLH
jgi:phytoene desaturase